MLQFHGSRGVVMGVGPDGRGQYKYQDTGEPYVGDPGALTIEPARPPVSTSPNYGPAGKPSTGRVVRLHILKQEIPATIYAADPESGKCTLTYDLIFSDGKISREYSRHVPFGPQADPTEFYWDWLPRA